MIARRGLSDVRHPPIGLLGFALAMFAALAAILPTPAAGHTASVGAGHSLTFVPLASSGLSGQLTSQAVECASGRSVTIYRAGGSGDVAAASTSAGPYGSWWHQVAGFQAGDYYAVATGSVVKSPGHKHTCAAARSNTVTVPPDGDGDGVSDPYDNCPSAANPGQQDMDGDRTGDACDDDADGDGFTAAGGDCADTDRNRYPGRPDTTRNGIDDNCDGTADEGYYAGIAYSVTYLKLIAWAPRGYADDCDIAVFLNPTGGTVCDARVDIQYFYPNGALGDRPWVIDPSSPTGWSIEPHPCDVLTEADHAEWLAYLEADPEMDDPELKAALTHPFDLYVSCYVPFEGF